MTEAATSPPATDVPTKTEPDEEGSIQGDASKADEIESSPNVVYRDFKEWRGKDLIDPAGEKIGKLEDVYFDVETDQPQFATVKQGLIGRHLTFVPLAEVTIGPDNLQVSASKALVKHAPTIELTNDELSQEDESTLYHYYQLNYVPSDTPSSRRLARR
jgi:hypothetical protein